MSAYNVIKDIGNILVNILWMNFEADRVVKDIIGSKTQITFNSPAEMETHTLSLFLYRIAENPFLRNQEIEQPHSDPLAFPPFMMDLHYLITPRTKNREDEHRVAGKILQIFHDHPMLRDQDFINTETLEGTTEEFRVTFNPLPMESVTELWNLFRETPYMLSLCYQVSPVSIDSIKTTEAKRVQEKEMQYYQIIGKKEST